LPGDNIKTGFIMKHHLIKQYAVQAFVFPLRIIIGWGILVPLSYLIPKNDSIIFITRFSNNFDGNLKYLFLYFADRIKDYPNIFFLTSDHGVEKDLKSDNLPVLFYPKISSLFRLLRAGTIIVDGNEWIRKFKYYPLYNSRKIQLWHGSGMKTVALLKPNIMKLNPIAQLALKIIGNHPYYDLLILNSTVQKNTRAKAFKYKELMINGQPRNDIFFRENIEPFLAGIDSSVYRKCEQYKNEGYKLAVYSPTHRDPSEEFLALKETFDIKRLNRFAVENKIIFIFKYHPSTLKDYEYDLSGASNIISYRKTCDVYPLLTKCDLMITDYSSIFVDYIIQDKPVVFFPFDYDYYVNNARALQFDYEEVTPGRKCFTYEELEAELKQILVHGVDEYSEKRKDVLTKFFDTVDGNSCYRILNYIEQNK